MAALRAGEGAASVRRDEALEARQAERVAAQQYLRRLEARLLANWTCQVVVGHLFRLVLAAVVDGVHVRHRKSLRLRIVVGIVRSLM